MHAEKVQPHFAAAAEAHARGRREEAIEHLRAGLAICPDDPVNWHNLATLMATGGDAPGAEEAYRRAISIQPDFPEALNALGELLARSGRIDEAIEQVRRALQSRPDFAAAMSNLASLLAARFQYDDAWPLFRRAISLQPDLLAAHHSYANALFLAGEYDAMVEVLRALLARWPDDFAAHANLATALRSIGKFHQALPHYDAALQSAAPNPARDAFIRLNRGICLLFLQDLPAGLADYESRLQLDPLSKLAANLRSRRLSPDDQVQGTSVLLLHEQGLGDSVFFARFIPLLAARGARVILRVPQSLVELLRRVEGVSDIIDTTDPPPPHEFHCPMMSLAYVLGITQQTIPSKVPYVRASDDAAVKWKQRLSAEGAGLRIGIAWRGSDQNFRNRLRSASLRDFAALAGITGCVFYSLQFGLAGDDIKESGLKLHMIDLRSEISDFNETAALMSNLDLVISVDTATVHLAGALGQPVWTLLDAGADWRWLRDRCDSPWYPTMRLFRQKRSRQWQPVFQEVAEALKDLLTMRTGR